MITGARNVAYGRHDRAGVEELVYAATGSQTAAWALPAAATLSLWAVGPRLARAGARAGAEGGTATVGHALFGATAPAPSGPVSDALRATFLRCADMWGFRMRAGVWSRLNGMGAIDWAAFGERLTFGQFREFKNFTQGARSLGWAGPNPGSPGQWLFGVPGWLRSIPLVGRSSVQHELLHALQDFKYGLFAQNEAKVGFLRGVWIESAAHIYGGPVIGGMAVIVVGGCVVGLVYIGNDIYRTIEIFRR